MATSDSDSEGNLVVDDGNGVDRGNLLKGINNKIHDEHVLKKYLSWNKENILLNLIA